jgi:hypothetical protein
MSLQMTTGRIITTYLFLLRLCQYSSHDRTSLPTIHVCITLIMLEQIGTMLPWKWNWTASMRSGCVHYFASPHILNRPTARERSASLIVKVAVGMLSMRNSSAISDLLGLAGWPRKKWISARNSRYFGYHNTNNILKLSFCNCNNQKNMIRCQLHRK